jgi:hypothetical protein
MILFIHNPHTGGTAFATELRRRGQLANDWDWGHMSAREWQLLYPELWEASTKVAIVRNPWDRLVSIYEHECRRWNIKTEFDAWLFETPRRLMHPFDYRRISQYDFLKTRTNIIDYKVLLFEKDLNDITPYYYDRSPTKGLSPDRPHYSKYYTEKSKSFVEIFFEHDINYWGYTYETG